MKYNRPKFVDTDKATNKWESARLGAHNGKAAKPQVSNAPPISRTQEKNRINSTQAGGRK